MKKKIKFIVGILLFAIILFAGMTSVNAEEQTYTASSTINGATVNWSYKLNDSNEVTDLVCTNVSDVTGDITIPSTIDGKNVVSLGSNAFKGCTGITGVTIPNTVKEIDLWAFSGCTNLSKVDLGNVERIENLSFQNCTSLTEIKIPKTLKEGASGAPFSGCTNLTKIELEDGMTIIPLYLCASTPITEITIPNTVKEIDLWAFANCENLKKITILDNVEKIDGYDTSNTDYVFRNHNDDLTIYCYEDSMAAKYAIRYNIKYVYLKKETQNTSTNNEQTTTNDGSGKSTTSTNSSSTSSKKSESSSNSSTESASKSSSSSTKSRSSSKSSSTPKKLPYTGIGITGVFAVIVVAGIAVITYRKYNYLKGIK